MIEAMESFLPGRHLVQVPGPTNVPREVLAAMAAPTIDHRGPEFAALCQSLLGDLPGVFGASGPVVLFAGSGTGAWEAALANTCSPGDKVLAVETGHFAKQWANLAGAIGLVVETLETDWRSPVDTGQLATRLKADTAGEIHAVLVVHNETSTGTTSDIGAVRAVLDETGHQALLLVDAVSSLASIDYRHDEWGVDVTVAGSQKGLMLPPGLGINAISTKALDAATRAKAARGYFDWAPVLEANRSGFFPYTPPTNLLFGLRAALDRLEREGLQAVFARHRRHAEATRAAVAAWGLELQCRVAGAQSPTVTAVRMPDGWAEERLRAVVLERYGMALGAGLGRLAGSVFRIGHLGDFDDLSLVATLAGIELSLQAAGVPHQSGGVDTALKVLATSSDGSR